MAENKYFKAVAQTRHMAVYHKSLYIYDILPSISS